MKELSRTAGASTLPKSVLGTSACRNAAGNSGRRIFPKARALGCAATFFPFAFVNTAVVRVPGERWLSMLIHVAFPDVEIRSAMLRFDPGLTAANPATMAIVATPIPR